MNPLLLTMTFLALMSIFTSSEMSRFAKGSIERHLHDNYMDTQKKLAEEKASIFLEELSEDDDLEDLQPRPKPPTAVPVEEEKKDTLPISSSWKALPLKFNEKRPPNNSRLSLYDLINEKKGKKKLPGEFSLYETMARLMRLLYSDLSFFQTVPNVEYRILDRLIDSKECAQNFIFPDEFATIDFQDPVLQEVFYQMMKGAAGVEKGYPSLLNYIAFNEGSEPGKNPQRKKINFLFAPDLVIEAVFPDKQVAKALIKMKQEKREWILELEAIRERMSKEEWPGRSGVNHVIEEEFKKILDSYRIDPLYKQVFVFSFGAPGDVLFIQDPDTGVLIREKYKK